MEGDECSTDEDCAPSNLCDAGVCILESSTCDADGDCSDGGSCEVPLGRIHHVCVPNTCELIEERVGLPHSSARATYRLFENVFEFGLAEMRDGSIESRAATALTVTFDVDENLPFTILGVVEAEDVDGGQLYQTALFTDVTSGEPLFQGVQCTNDETNSTLVVGNGVGIGPECFGTLSGSPVAC